MTTYHNCSGNENNLLQFEQNVAIKDQNYLFEGLSNMRLKNCGVIIGLALLQAVSVFAGEPVVMVDQGHGQRFVIEEKGELHLSRFAEIMKGAGAQVVSTKKPLSAESLKEISALVISGPFESLKPEEVQAVAHFIDGGGRLAVMLHIGSPLSGLLARLDLDNSNAVIHEKSNIIDADSNFRVTNLMSSPLFSGVTHFSLYGGWALDPGKTGVVLAQTSSDAWADLDGNKVLSKGDVIGAFSVAVSGSLGSGGFVVFGDDALFQNRYLDENNGRLAANLAGWLVGK